MPKKITELTDEQAIRKLFPKKVVEELKKVAHEKDGTPKEPKKEEA